MIISFAGQKGGAGKTTLAVSLSTELAARGRSVLLVDADPQRSASKWHDLATFKARERAKAANGGGEGAVPNETALEGLPSVISMTGTLHEKHQLPKLARPYDDVIIDCPGRLSDVIRSSLMVAQAVILPCGASHFDAWALDDTIKIVKEAQIIRRKLKAVLVVNQKRAGTDLGESARADLQAASGLPVLKSEIGLREAFKKCIGEGQGINAYAPHDEGTDEVRALLTEIAALVDEPLKRRA